MGSSKKVTIGYQYFLGLHMVWCDNSGDDEITINKFVAGDRVAYDTPITSSSTITIAKPHLFGGDKKEGGIVSDVDIAMGEPTQTQNSYLQAQLGTNIPAFRGVVSSIIKAGYMTAMSPYIKPWAASFTRLAAKAWYTAKADINSGSANPAHILYECITNNIWGLGEPPSSVDNVSFQAAADTLHTESFGLSFLYTRQTSAEEFINQILGHISGVIYTDITNGKWKLRLFRFDYTPASLEIFDETKIISLDSFERPGWAELVNEVVVRYRPRETIKDDSVVAQNLASIQKQGGVRSQTNNYHGIDSFETASKVAERDLRQLSAPLARIKIKVNRNAWDLDPGDLIKFSWGDLGVSELVARVIAINYGTIDDPTIFVELIEDVFALPTTSYLSEQPSQWVEPVDTALASPLRRLEELNYFDATQNFTAGEIAALDSTSAFLQMLAIKPLQAAINYQLQTRTSSGSFEIAVDGDFTPNALLGANITRSTTAITFTSPDSLVQLVSTGTYAFIDDEIVRIDAIDVGTLTATIARGCIDTVPATHTSGTRIFFAEEFDAVDPEERADGETIFAKVQTRTGQDLLSLASAPEDSIVFTGRIDRPYPPGNLTFNTAYFPTFISGELNLAWAHRDRTQQTASIIDFLFGDIGPEVGTTYTIRIYDQTLSLVRTETGITGTAYTYTQVNEEADNGLGRFNYRLRIEVLSVRGGTDSFQIHDFTFDRAGYGLNYGLYYGGGI